MIIRLLSFSSFIVILDRLTKYLALTRLSEGESISVVPGVFHITLVLNTGVAFGLFKGCSIIFIVSSVLIIAAICMYLWRSKCRDFWMLLAMGLIIGGAVGNLIDRASFGYVIDFLDFRIWPVFNVADSSVTVGAVILAIKLLRDKRCCMT